MSFVLVPDRWQTSEHDEGEQDLEDDHEDVGHDRHCTEEVHLTLGTLCTLCERVHFRLVSSAVRQDMGDA